MPEWDDYVDGNYDFEHDEHSTLSTDDRDIHYIWDIFDYENTPIDGVLISREQIESNGAKAERIREEGLYGNGSVINFPDWLPTISDCGAWGYKSLPFPPYGNRGMLEFYEDLGVDIGVTIDHLVLGSGEEGRLYLDERAFEDSPLSKSHVEDELEDDVDIMIEEWPEDWPDYVQSYEPSIYGQHQIGPFSSDDFSGSASEIIERLKDDSRAVYRSDDTQFRYSLTLENAESMKALYDENGYSFRLMVAIQGWDPPSYVKAARSVLDQGYDHLGIGGAAGSGSRQVKDIVSGVGNAVKEYERKKQTRIDTHLFGFAKTDAFDTVGRSGMTSFDSASMLLSAFQGGNNYHLDSERKYDAIRVRMGSNRDPLEKQIETALLGQEILHALRAYDDRRSIATAIEAWQEEAHEAIENLADYLQTNRFNEEYDQRLLQDIESAFREEYTHSAELRASFSKSFRKEIVKLLREDDPNDPIPFREYLTLIEKATTKLQNFPSKLTQIRKKESDQDSVATFNHIWYLVKNYAKWIGDDDLLDEYKRLLRERPWEECGCTICENHGIEVAIFRGNNRNRRRGFHNTRIFYDQFEKELPKLLVAIRGSASINRYDTVEDFLKDEYPEFWSEVHDLPVAEIGAYTAQGVHEWWEPTPDMVSFEPEEMRAEIKHVCGRYQNLFLVDSRERTMGTLGDDVEDCEVNYFENPTELRSKVLDRLKYESDFLPDYKFQSGIAEFK